MHPFALSRTDDPGKAIAAHAHDPQLAFIAGGTDLLGLMKDRAALPERLLDINGLPNMARIEAMPGGGVRIGALARMSDVAANTEVRQRFPVIAEALLFAASGQLCNMTSIGGNIMRRTRCAYFRDEIGCRCNKRNWGSGCAAFHGFNRNHAIFGWSESCVATNPSDLAVALAVMDAIVIVQGNTGERLIPFTDFHRLPGGTPERDNVLDRGDLIVAIEVPANVEASASHYLKVRDRASYEFALVSTAAAVETDGRRIRLRGLGWAALRISLGGSQRLKPRCAEFRWTTSTGSDQRLLHRSPMPAPSPIMPSKSSWLSALPCVHCKPREHAHERCRTTDLTRRRPAEG
jgi:xanthine dehydrogenase YagS FAD-binding subunit